MKYSLITAALLALLVSIDAAPLTSPPQFQLVREIVSVLENTIVVCNRTQKVCRAILVKEVVQDPHQKERHECDVFGIAATTIRSVNTEVRALNKYLAQLGVTLKINGHGMQQGKSEKCLGNVEIDLHTFLEWLLDFARLQYRQMDVKSGHSTRGK